MIRDDGLDYGGGVREFGPETVAVERVADGWAAFVARVTGGDSI